MPRILVGLSDDEYRVLLAAAKRDRRTAQAQAAQILVGLLSEWNRLEQSAKAQSDARAAGGAALSPEQEVGAVEGHRDGAAAGVNEVVVLGAGEAQ